MVEVSKDGLERARDAYSVEWFKVPDGTHAFVRAETAALAAIATLQAERDRYRGALEGLLEGVYGDGYVLPAGARATARARHALALSDTPTVQS